MPVLYRQLAGDDGGPAPVPVLEDLQQVPALVGGQGRQAPVIEDE
jgi:hypothetical protein